MGATAAFTAFTTAITTSLLISEPISSSFGFYACKIRAGRVKCLKIKYAEITNNKQQQSKKASYSW
jgi:hypothetical protein